MDRDEAACSADIPPLVLLVAAGPHRTLTVSAHMGVSTCRLLRSFGALSKTKSAWLLCFDVIATQLSNFEISPNCRILGQMWATLQSVF